MSKVFHAPYSKSNTLSQINFHLIHHCIQVNARFVESIDCRSSDHLNFPFSVARMETHEKNGKGEKGDSKEGSIVSFVKELETLEIFSKKFLTAKHRKLIQT